MKSFTQSAINAYEEVINENGPDETLHMWNICEAETIKSTLFYVALLVYLAKATNFVLFLDKVWSKIKKSIVTRNAVLVSVCDTCQLRATLVSVVDTPIHQRTQQQPILELVHDAPMSRRPMNVSDQNDGKSSVKVTLDCESTCDTACESTPVSTYESSYVKNWKEERIKRQLLEMWNALDENGQKEWLDKADALDKLFGLTDSSDVYKDTVTPKYPKTEFCKLLTKHASARAYFESEMAKFRKFYDDHQEPGKPQVTASWQTDQARNQQQQQMLSAWISANRDNQTYTNKVLQEWKSSDNVSVRKSLREAVCDAMTYNTIPKTTDEQIWAKTAKEWEASYDAFEHAYDLFCEKVKNTNPQMKVTEDDLNEHLSRMWEVLDDKVANTTGYAYFRGCNRDGLTKTNPGMSKTDLDTKLTRMWMELSKKEREDWADSSGVMTQRTRHNN